MSNTGSSVFRLSITVYLLWSLCTFGGIRHLELLACQVRVAVWDSGLGVVFVFEGLLNTLFVDSSLV